MSLRTISKNRVACSCIRFRSSLGVPAGASFQTANTVLISEWVRRVIACSRVSWPLVTRASIRPRKTTASATSSPFISGSLVGNKSNCFDESSKESNEVSRREELPTLFTKIVIDGRTRYASPNRLNIFALLQFVQVQPHSLRVKAQKSLQVFLSNTVRLRKAHEDFQVCFVGLICVWWHSGGIGPQKFPGILWRQIAPFVILKREHMRAFGANEPVRAFLTKIAPRSQRNLLMRRTIRRKVSIPANPKSRLELSIDYPRQVKDVEKQCEI